MSGFSGRLGFFPFDPPVSDTLFQRLTFTPSGATNVQTFSFPPKLLLLSNADSTHNEFPTVWVAIDQLGVHDIRLGTKTGSVYTQSVPEESAAGISGNTIDFNLFCSGQFNLASSTSPWIVYAFG